MERFIHSNYRSMIENNYAEFVDGIRQKMDETGLATVGGFIDPAFLTELQASVEQLTPLCYKGGKRKYLVGNDLKDTGCWEVAFSEFMLKLSNDILRPFHVQVESGDIHPAMNILVGENGQDTVRGWHFDATYLTVAMPIVMPPPSAARDGKFRIWPNLRPFSQSKLQNKVYSALAQSSVFRRVAKSYDINFVPGSLYFFYGFRSYHGTAELDATQLRANCLINFGGPFFDLQKGKAIQYGRSGS